MNSRKPARIRTTNIAWLDFAVLGGLLCLINFLSAADDPGWMQVNPTPWLLLPLFIGARYGFGWGLGSGGLVAVLIIAAQIILTGRDPSAILDPVFFHLSLPAVGFIAGEARAALQARLADREADASSLTDKCHKLEADLEVAEQARFELQEHLALQGSELCSIDVHLRSLFAPGAPPVFSRLLRILRENTGLTDAAVYALQNGDLRRVAVIGDDRELPESLHLADTEIAALAVSRSALTTCRELWERTPEMKSPFIAAMPLQNGGHEITAVLLVHRMPFLSVNWKTFARMEMICRWVAQIIDLNAAVANAPAFAGCTSLVVSEDAFDRTLGSALATHRDFHLPSCVAAFVFTRPVLPHVASLLPRAVAPVMRGSDVATFDESSGLPQLRIILPMEGTRDAGVFLDRAQRAIMRVPQLRGIVSAHLSMTEIAGDRVTLPGITPQAQSAGVADIASIATA